MFEGLAPGTAFQVRARTTNSAGASAWSEPREHCSHQRPFENGGLGPGYAWKQSHASVTLLVPVGAGVRGRDVAAKCTSDAVRLSVGGVEVVAGKWREIVLPDEFTWEIDDDATVAPNLTGRRVLSATVAKCTETPFELWPNALKVRSRAPRTPALSAVWRATRRRRRARARRDTPRSTRRASADSATTSGRVS